MIVCLPSRGRPQSLARLVAQCERTQASASFWVRLDAGDPQLKAYLAIDYPRNWCVVVGPQARAAAAMRELFAVNPGEQSYLQMGDDTIPRTQAWDRRLEDEALRCGISYPNDGIHGSGKVTHPVVCGALLRQIGFWALPGLTHLYVDTALEHIGERLGCLSYCGDVLLDHLHFSVGKSPFDETYIRVDNGADAACFNQWKASQSACRLVARLSPIVPSIAAGSAAPG